MIARGTTIGILLWMMATAAAAEDGGVRLLDQQMVAPGAPAPAAPRGWFSRALGLAGNFSLGFVEALGGTVKGLVGLGVGLVTDPVGTVSGIGSGLYQLVTDPSRVVDGVRGWALELGDAARNDPEKLARMLGHASFHVALSVGAGAGVLRGASALRAARAVRVASGARRGVTAARIAELRPLVAARRARAQGSLERARSWAATTQGKPLSAAQEASLLPLKPGGARMKPPEFGNLVGWEQGTGTAAERAVARSHELRQLARRARLDPVARGQLDQYVSSLRGAGVDSEIAARWAAGYERNAELVAGTRGVGNVGGSTALARAELMRTVTGLLTVP